MAGYYYLYIVCLVVGICISIYLITRLVLLRKTPGAANLIWAISAVVIWSFGYIFEILFTDWSIKYTWAKIEYLGIPFVALALFTFALIYSGRGKWLTRTNYILLTIIPAIDCILALSNDVHRLLWSTVDMPAGSTIGPLTVGHGPWYDVNIGYSYLLLLLTTIIFAQITLRSRSLYRVQAGIMLFGMIIPWIGNVFYILSLGPVPSLDWTPMTLTITMIAIEIGFARFGLMDVLPVAYSTVFGAIREGVVVTDTKGRIVEINPAAERIFDRSGDKLIGQEIGLILPSEADLNRQDGVDIEIVRDVSLGNGSGLREYNLRIYPVTGRRGQVTGRLVTLTDVTEQKRAQSQMLLQSTALEAAENGIVITDAAGCIEWTNPAFTRLTGYERHEVLGKSPSVLKSGKQADEFYRGMWETILAGKVWHSDLVNRRKDGTLYDEEMTIAPLIENQEITHFIAIKQNVTERKRAEEELRQAHQTALEANRMKTQLLASVSHDLRTPLGAIMGYAEMIQSGVLGEVNGPQQTAAAEILDSTNQLLVFVNNLISQAQIETGRVVLKIALFAPPDLVEAVRSTIGYMAQKKALTIQTEIDPALPEQLLGDAYWLKQILLNLVNNAVKFTDKGSVTIRFIKPDAQHWAIQVADTGIGIPKESQQAIFEVFRQADNAATRKQGGSGIGLSIVRQLSNLMGATIALDSQVGQGSTFTVILPLASKLE